LQYIEFVLYASYRLVINLHMIAYVGK